MFADNIIADVVLAAVALVYFGRWSPWGILAGSLLFSMADSVQLWVQVLGINFPYELAVILPYVVTIIALAMTFGRIWAPAWAFAGDAGSRDISGQGCVFLTCINSTAPN